ncbi:MAG UNVERIFIED_CONTAM: hypothetical protein LVR29_05520 [Microcystis novacekii LVE1205-3]|jgi:hypothetical protein
MAFFRQYIAPFLTILVFLVALVATGIRIFLPADLAAPAPIRAIPGHNFLLSLAWLTFPKIISCRLGKTGDRYLLINFLTRTYQEFFPEQKNLSHLADTVRQFFARYSPVDSSKDNKWRSLVF